jgi:hypothetical protein
MDPRLKAPQPRNDSSGRYVLSSKVRKAQQENRMSATLLANIDII